MISYHDSPRVVENGINKKIKISRSCSGSEILDAVDNPSIHESIRLVPEWTVCVDCRYKHYSSENNGNLLNIQMLADPVMDVLCSVTDAAKKKNTPLGRRTKKQYNEDITATPGNERKKYTIE